MKRRQHQHLLESLVHSTAKQQGDFAKTAELATELLCQNLTVSSVSVWTFSPDQQSQSLVAQFGAMMLQDIHRPKLLQACPRYLYELKTRRHIDAGNTLIDPRLSELSQVYFNPRQVFSCLMWEFALMDILKVFSVLNEPKLHPIGMTVRYIWLVRWPINLH